MTSVSFGIAIFTPPVSGQFCREPCLFEVVVISIDWLVLMISAFMLAVVFHRDAVRIREPEIRPAD